MTTIAAIARIISAHAGVADVERWAAALHEAGELPGPTARCRLHTYLKEVCSRSAIGFALRRS